MQMAEVLINDYHIQIMAYCFHSDACGAASHQGPLQQAGEGQVFRCVYESHAACCLHVVPRLTKKICQFWVTFLIKILSTI